MTTRIHLTTVAALFLYLQGAAWAQAPENFIYTSAGDLDAAKALLARPDIGGAQVVYNWKSLKTAKGRYDFSQIEKDLAVLQGLNKKLFIQVQDRFSIRKRATSRTTS